MQLDSLIKPISRMSPEELTLFVRAIRERREQERPSFQRHVRKAKEKVVKVKVQREKTKATKKSNDLNKLLAEMSPADIQQLLLSLGEG